MEFETLTLEHLGGGGDNTIITEVDQKMQSLAALVLHDDYGSAASVVVEISLHAQGEAVVITAKVKEKRPSRRHKGLVAHLDYQGRVVTQRAEQLELTNVSSIEEGVER